MPNPELASDEGDHRIPRTLYLLRKNKSKWPDFKHNQKLKGRDKITYQPLQASVQIAGLYGLFGKKLSQ